MARSTRPRVAAGALASCWRGGRTGRAARELRQIAGLRSGQGAYRPRRRVNATRARRHKRGVHGEHRCQGDCEHAASSALIKQIAQGAAADVFASADSDWMDWGLNKKLIKDARVNLLGNELVLIAPSNSKLDSVAIGQNLDLAKLAGDGSIAIADVGDVPAGKYAKAALEALGAWQAAAPKLAMTPNVRVALKLVTRGDAPLGIVYTTDAKVSPGVKIIGTFPANSHPPIIYPVAATVTAKPQAVGYLAYLRSMTAKAIFEQYGFEFRIQPAS